MCALVMPRLTDLRLFQLWRLQEHGELVAAFQQQVQHAPQAWAAPAEPAGCIAGGMPAEASQRAVIRSLAAQVASLQQRLEQAGGSASGSAAASPACSGCGPQPQQQQQQQHAATAPAAGAGLAHLAGMFVLVKQQLTGLERMQQQLEAASSRKGAASASAASPGASAASTSPSHSSGGSGAGRYLASTAHAAALLGAELPALRATVDVMEAEVRRMAAEATPASVPPHSSQPLPQRLATEPALCLPAPAAAAPVGGLDAADLLQRKAKWKARCKETQAQLATASTAAQQVEAALRAQLADAERSAAEHATQQAGAVDVLQARVEELAAAGAQLERVLHQTAGQLTEAAGAAAALQQQLDQQAREHDAAMQQADQRLEAAQVGGWVGGWVGWSAWET